MNGYTETHIPDDDAVVFERRTGDADEPVRFVDWRNVSEGSTA